MPSSIDRDASNNSHGARGAFSLGPREADCPPALFTIDAATGYSGFTRSRLYELIGSDTIQAVKAGRRTLIVGDSLRAYLATLPRADIRMGRKAA